MSLRGAARRAFGLASPRPIADKAAGFRQPGVPTAMTLTDFDTLTFDCYGTLIDWEAGILAVLEPWAARRGLEVDGPALLEGFGRHETVVQRENPGLIYPEVLRAVMRALAADFGIAASEAEADALGRSVADWPAFPDSREALAYLKKHYRLVVLSNVDRASFAHSAARLGVAFDAVYTAEDVGSYKPDPANFRFLLDRLAEIGVRPEDILHTAQSLYHDHAPAAALGLATCWINRRQGKDGAGATPPAEAEPDMEFPSLAAFAAHHAALVGRA